MNTKIVWSIILLLVVVFIGVVLFANTGESPSDVETADNEETAMNDSTTPMRLTSSVFAHQGTIPEQFTCDGDNTNPPLSISGIPEGAVSLALLMDDPDIPEEVQGRLGSSIFDHWVLFNISPDVSDIAQGEAPGTEGVNSSGEIGYTGPCPPAQFEPTEHRYIFTIYALDQELDVSEGATKEEVLEAMEGRVIAETRLIGKYDRSEN